jgi:hypothetical protein
VLNRLSEKFHAGKNRFLSRALANEGTLAKVLWKLRVLPPALVGFENFANKIAGDQGARKMLNSNLNQANSNITFTSNTEENLKIINRIGLVSAEAIR